MSSTLTPPALSSSTTAGSAKDFRKSRRPHWWRWLVPRFSLRTLLIAITCSCLALGLWISRAERQRSACEQLTKLGWDWRFQEDAFVDDPGPEWFQRIPSILRQGDAVHYWRSLDIVSGDGNRPSEAVDLVAQLPALRKLVLADRLDPLPADAWKKIGRLTTLRDLDLSQTAIDDDGMAHIGRLHNLRSLNLSETIVGDAGAQHLRNMPGLEVLYLSETNVGDDGLAALAGLTRLRTLGLTETSVTGAGLKHLAALTSIETLFLSGTDVDDRIGEIVAGMSRLESFDADDTKLTDASGAIMFTSPALTTISLHGTRIGSQTLAAVAELPKLTELDVRSTLLKAGDISLLRNATSLQTARLPIETSLDEVVALRHLPSLNYVVTGMDKLTLEHLAALDGVCDGGGSLEFDLSHCRLGREGWSKLASSRNVAVLRAEYSDLDDEALAKLAEIPTLCELRLTGCPITDAGLASLSKCRMLSKLDLSECSVTDSGLEHLGTIDFLESLTLSDCQGVTDAGMRHLAPIQITRLDLSGTSVTNAGLKDFPSPHQLFLDRTSVTRDGLFGLGQRQRLEFVDLTGSTFHENDLLLFTNKTLDMEAEVLCLPKDVPFARLRARLVSGGHKVTHLSLIGQSLADADVEVLDRLFELEEVTLFETPLSPAICRWIRSRMELTTLDLGGVEISDETVDDLKGCRVTDLKLRDTKISVEQLRKLADISTVTSLDLVRCPLTEEHLDVLATLGKKLNHLGLLETGLPADAMRKRLPYFVEVSGLDWEGHHVSHEQLQWMTAFQKDDPSLLAAMKRSMTKEVPATSHALGFCCCWSGPFHKEMNAMSRLVTDPLATRYLSQGRDAQTVDLSGAEIGPGTMRELAQFRWLISLDLSKSTIRDSHFNGKHHWSQLRTFIADDCQLGDEGIQRLADCRRLTAIRLDRTLISDSALKTVGQMRFLTTLSISKTKITDDGLTSLYGLRHLRYLWVSDTNVTPQGIAELRKQLPYCRIYAAPDDDAEAYLAFLE
jgi:internalin A